ncbi:hypothetical protein [Hoeflea sp.]|uniref:hypothetical protein n=1 Tax=Hoeflea sp. TaxID=1940281 RepID=UPI0019C047B4|nr:hypothetical protein [Hoeflea sp.]MBC7281837.1 hypothetical protein [Hoeflea sp.]
MTTMDFAPLLESMHDNLDRGAFPELGFQLDFYRPIALKSGDAGVVDTFDRYKRQADAGLEHERVHGRWSLLKHDHPVTLRLKARGYYSDLKAA